MKYAVVRVLDQTIGFLTPDGDWTVKHPEAKLFDVKSEAEAAVKEVDSRLRTHWDDGTPVPEEVRYRWTAWTEDVPDEAEFRAREDTW